MVGACKNLEEGLVSLAEGLRVPEVESHVADCAACARKLAELKQMVGALRISQFEAPTDLVARAIGLMPNQRRQLLARLLSPRMALSPARSVASDGLALQVGADEFVVRLLLAPIGSPANPRQWEVSGMAPSADWQVVRGETETPCGESGRFKFSVSRLSDTAFVLRSAKVEVAVPSAQELIDDES